MGLQGPAQAGREFNMFECGEHLPQDCTEQLDLPRQSLLQDLIASSSAGLDDERQSEVANVLCTVMGAAAAHHCVTVTLLCQLRDLSTMP
mmetsp:Transcript_59805/g.142399  ORF Transcript_59805/g.142399 Transcript_59805/m.142399 type:complete len:90 (-) Transcript_59805:15-284(-)